LSKQHVRVGHSPDPDDAFMWWPLSSADTGFDTGRFRYDAVPADIEALNRLSETGDLEITAMSCAQAARVADKYAITSCGASIGQGYGPKIVAARPLAAGDLKDSGAVLAIPGIRTTAFAATCMLLGPKSFRHEEVPFDGIIERVAAGEFTAGLVTHEGQLTFGTVGLHLGADLGMWWSGHSGLPLPLGVNAVRRDLDALHGEGTRETINSDLRRCLEFALDHREQALAYAMRFARGLAPQLAGEFIDMYVNRWTLDLGSVGKAAIRTFLEEAHRAGVGPDPARVEFVG